MSKSKKGVTVVALTTIVQAPGSCGVLPGSQVMIEDPAEAARMVAAGRAALPPETSKEKPAARAPDQKDPDEGALV